MKPYAFGIDIGGTTVKIGLFETKGTLFEKWEIPTHKDDRGKYILPEIAQSIKDNLLKNDLTIADIEGLGVGVPGPILEDGRVNQCVNLGWGVFNIERALSELLDGIYVKANNDANVAALGEMWQGGAKGFDNVIMVTLGTGVGGGVIVGGKIIPGSFGASGEIGHIQVSKTETSVCGCGKKGCLEQYASATGIVRKAQQLLKSSNKPSVLRKIHRLSAKEIFDAAKAGDEISLELVEFLGETLGTALSYISCVVDPQIFVIGGGISKAGPFLLNVIQKYYKIAAFHASRNAKFVLAALGSDAGMYGAVQLVLAKK